MSETKTVTLTCEECCAIHTLIGILSGHSPENVFLWDGTDDPADPATSAFVKVYRAAGAKVPAGLAGEAS